MEMAPPDPKIIAQLQQLVKSELQKDRQSRQRIAVGTKHEVTFVGYPVGAFSSDEFQLEGFPVEPGTPFEKAPPRVSEFRYGDILYYRVG